MAVGENPSPMLFVRPPVHVRFSSTITATWSYVGGGAAVRPHGSARDEGDVPELVDGPEVVDVPEVDDVVVVAPPAWLLPLPHDAVAIARKVSATARRKADLRRWLMHGG